MTKSGLWIGEDKIGRDAAQFLSVLKYVCIPETSWTQPAFHSDDVSQVIALAESLSLEIVSAMMDDYLLHEFETRMDLVENIALRKAVIAAMQAICSGEFDADYTEATVGVPPTLGYLENLEVLFAPNADTGKGVLSSPAPFRAPDSAWYRLSTSNPWSGNAFVQKANKGLSTALAATRPFRGECAGALQLSVLNGCHAALGAEKLDVLNKAFGPALVGVWHLPAEGGEERINTLATRFLTQLGNVPASYQRGAVLGVPGDYFYFQNKDDYPDLAPTGGWRGENCIYMGQDALGGPHYSGMGLGWKTEFALRMFLSNAYFNDCNTGFLETLRAGKTPSSTPAIVEDPQAQVRFTSRGVMRYPELPAQPVPKMQIPSNVQNPLSNAEYHKRLIDLGFQESSPDGGGQHLYDELQFKKLINGLEFPESALHQSNGTGPQIVSFDVHLGLWKLVIRPCDPELRHLSMNERVKVTARLVK